MAESIKYSWEDIKSFKADDMGIEVTLKDSGYPSPSEGTSESSEYPKPFSVDSLGLGMDETKFVFSDSGSLIIPEIVVAKEIVQDYSGKKVYKSADEIKKLVPFLDHLRVTGPEHPENDFITSPSEVKGVIVNPRFVDGNAVCDLEVRCPDLIKLIKDGDLREVSIGFQSEVLEKSGMFGDSSYDYVQTNILPDHLAIVTCGRCSLADGCGIPPEKVADNGTLSAAAKIVDSEKVRVIDKILKMTDLKTRDELQTDSLEKLQKDLNFMEKYRADNLPGKEITALDSGADDYDTLRAKIDKALA